MTQPKIIKAKFVESIGYWCNVIQIDENSFAVENTKKRRDQITRDGLGSSVKYFDNKEDPIDFLEGM